MDCFHVGNLGRADNGWNVEIAERAFGRADAHRLVGKAHVKAVAVRFRVNRHRGDPQFLAGADHTQGNLTPVGDQDFVEQPFGRKIAAGAPDAGFQVGK